MAASRIFSRLAELLDVQVNRAAAVWLRLDETGEVSQRTAAETLGDLGAASTTALAGKASLTATNNFTATQSFAERVYLTEAVLGVVTSPIAEAYNGAGTGLTGTAANLSVGTATTAAYATTAGTASSISNAAVLAALPSTTPLPISSGGTGAANLDALQPKITSANASTTRTALGSKDVGDALFQAQTVGEASSILGIQSKTGTSTGLAAVGVSDITGLTGYTLEASTWYKLELHYLWTSTSSNFQINFVTTGTFERGGTTPALGQSMSGTTVISTTFFPASDSTYFSLRGSVGETRNNVGFFGYAYFKTGTSGTGKIQLQLLSGTTLSTINSAKAVLTKL